MITRTIYLKELISKTIEPAILVIDKKLNIQYQSANTGNYLKLPEKLTTLKQLDGLNKVAFSVIAKKATQSIKDYFDVKIEESILKGKDYSFTIKIQKLPTSLTKDVLFSVSISKNKLPKTKSSNHLHQKDELKEIKDRYKNLFEYAIDGLGVFDLNKQTMVHLNNSLVKMCGFSKAEIIAKAPVGVMTEFLEDGSPTIERYQQMISELKTKKESIAEFIHLHKTKAPFHIKVKVRKLPKPNQHLAYAVIKNIDAQKKAAAKSALRLKQLKASESRHKAFFNQSLDGHVILNLNDMKPVEVNKQMLQIMRISKKEYFNASPYDFFDAENNAENVEQIFKAYRESIETNTPFGTEVYIKSSKRKSFLVKVLITQLSAPNQHLVFAVIKDIDKERKAEIAANNHLKALAESENMFKTFFNNGLDGFGIGELRPEVKPIDANTTMCQLLGLSKKEFLSTNPIEFLSPQQSNNKSRGKLMQEILHSLKEKGKYTGDVEYLHKKKGSFCARVNMARFNTDNQDKIFIQVTNKDKEVKAQLQLAKSAALFKSVFTNSTDGIVIYDIESFGAIKYNERVLQMTNCSPSEFKKASLTEFLPKKQPNGKNSFSTFKKHLINITENKSINKEWIFKKYNADELIYTRISIIKLPHPFSNLAALSIADITKTKLAEQAIIEKNRAIELSNQKLKLSYQKFKDTFDNSANFIGRINLKGYLIEHNKAVAKTVADKSKPSTNILVWHFPWFINHKDAQKTLKQDFEQVKKGLSTKSQVTYSISPNFSGILEYTFKPLKNENESVIGILAEGYDITPQVNTLKRLEFNEQKFRAVYNNSSNFIGIFNTKGILLDFNKTISNKLSKNMKSTVDVPIWEFPFFTKHKNAQQTLKKAIKKAITGVKATGVVNYSISTKFSGTMQYDINPIFDRKGKVIWLLSEGKDITNITITKNKLSYQEQKFRAIFNNSSNYIGLYNLDGTIEEINKPILNKIPKNRRSEIKSKTKLWQLPLSNSFKKVIKKTFNAALKKVLKGDIHKTKTHYTNNDNEDVFLEFIFSPVFDKNNKVFQILGESRDISEQVKSSKQIELNEKRFKALFFNAENIVVRLSPEGRVIDHNRIGNSVENYIKRSKYLGKYLWELSGIFRYTTSREKLKEDIQTAANGQLVTGTILSNQIRREDNRMQQMQLAYSFKPIFGEDNKTVEWILAEARDITTFTETQNQLIENQQKFKAIFYNSDNYIARLDAKGNVLEHNKIRETDLNYDSVKQYIGKPLWEFSGIAEHEQSVINLKKDIKKCSTGKFVTNQIEMVVNKANRSNSKPKYRSGLVVYSLTPVFNKKNVVDWILAEAKDITDLKETQNKLSISLNKYQKLFENNLVGIIILDENLKIIECNKAYEKITGFTLNETKKFNYYKLIDKNEVNEAKLNENKIRNTKINSLQFKRTFIKKNGKKIVLNLYLKPIYINNKFSKAVVTIADITELENKRKALKQSEELYKAVFEGVNDGLFVYDLKKQKVVAFNNRIVQIANLKSKKKFLAKTEELFLPYVKGEIIQKTNWVRKIKIKLKTQKFAKFDLSFEIAKDTPLHVSASTFKLTDSILLTTITDITETKKAKNALLESELRYRSLFENNVTGISLGNRFGEILQVNDALCAMFGYSKKEMLSLKHQDLPVNGASDSSYTQFKAMVEGKIKQYSATKQFIKKNGDIFYAIIFVNGIFDEQNNFKYEVVSISDISELKNLEHQLKEKQIELADKVIELEKYIESYLELENFAFIASHDLKAPTRTIINYSNLLLETAEKKLDDVELQFLKFIVEGSVRLQNTIRDLLSFSLTKNNALDIKKVNLNSLLKNIIKDLNSTIVETKATIEIERLPNYNWVDKGLYKELFLNLIGNALKFKAKRKKPYIKINCIKTKTDYLFSIEDNGIGIPKKFQEKIFGIFKRLHIYSEFEGTGIGLALCKKVVERHNGKIWVKSAKGKGSTFYFTLPNNLKKIYEKI